MKTIQWHRNSEKLCPLVKLNKQIAHEQKCDINALLIKTTLVCSSKIIIYLVKNTSKTSKICTTDLS